MPPFPPFLPSAFHDCIKIQLHFKAREQFLQLNWDSTEAKVGTANLFNGVTVGLSLKIDMEQQKV